MQVDIARIRGHIEALARFTATPGAGSTRLSYTDEFRQACEYIAGHARALGLSVRYDAIGNLRARFAGANPRAPAVLVGSHLDTVIHGGDFDGILGVVCGLEAMEVLKESGVQPECPLELVNFVEEEGTSFRCPLTGSKAVTDTFEVDDLKTLRKESGETLYDCALAFGLDPDRLAIDCVSRESVKAMLELHIEQGAVLESEGIPVGIVERIAGSENHRIRLQGRANHAGTTPMHLRYDAMAGAAELILDVERIASDRSRPDTVATVGRLHCNPNAVNVIPGQVELSVDVRDVEVGRIDSAAAAIREAVEGVATRRGLGWEMELTGRSAPQPLHGNIIGLLTRLAEEHGIPHRPMNSGALHDAAMLARVTDTGMIFVPSRGGRSHTPREWTDYADIEFGANLLLAALHRLAMQ
jgi:allantoate deiminase